MITLLFIVTLAIGISFICSIFEAVLLSITPSYIAALQQKHPKVATRIKRQQENIDSPLIAILTLNTIAHTVGAAVAGAQAAKVFGDAMLGLFSGVLTFLILFFSEIIPKTLGANYWRVLAPRVSDSLVLLEQLMMPLIWLSQKVTVLFEKKDNNHYIRQEMSALAQIGQESGELDPQESKILTQMLSVKEMPVTAIMTPRIVIFSLPCNMTLEAFARQYRATPFSRIPIYDKDPDDIIGFINRNDILLSEHNTPHERLKKLSHPLLVVPESAKILPLSELFIKRHSKIAIVVDEYGTNLGLVSLEDIVESLLGLEIVDSNDPATDMQQLAKKRWLQRIKEKGIHVSDSE